MVPAPATIPPLGVFVKRRLAGRERGN